LIAEFIFFVTDIDLESMLDDLTSNPLDVSLPRPSCGFGSTNSSCVSQRSVKTTAIIHDSSQMSNAIEDAIIFENSNTFEYENDNAEVRHGKDAVEAPGAVSIGHETVVVQEAQPTLSKRDILLKRVIATSYFQATIVMQLDCLGP
jgi:hypothetical protein